MLYALVKALTALLAPLGTGLACGLLAALLLPFKRYKSAVAISAVAVLWVGLWSTPWASHGIRRNLEANFPALDATATPTADAIVVLGGGISPPSDDNPQPNLHDAADRVWHAARLFRAGKAPRLVLSGGGDPDRRSVSEAQAMKQLLTEWHIPESAMLLEEHSRTTAENAQMTFKLLQRQGARSVLLVTSAMHMRRARALFEEVGFTVIPAATDHGAQDTSRWPWWRKWLPDTGALEGSSRALKEWVGQWVI